MSILKEFRDFAMRGNLIDMSIAFVMGAAFTKVTSAFIDGMVMPIVGLVQGKDFSNFYYPLSQKVRMAIVEAEALGTSLTLEKAREAGPVFAYGRFITVTIEFILVAFFMFLLLKAMNKMRRKEEAKPAAPPAPTKEEILLTEIRDALRNR